MAAAPGHQAPPGVDPSTPQSVVAWVASFQDQAFVDRNYAAMLIAEGYSSMYGLEFTVDEITEMDDVNGDNPPVGHARRMVRGAHEVMRSLGIFNAQAGVLAIAPGAAAGANLDAHDPQGIVAYKDRGEIPPFPSELATGVAGLATRTDMALFAAELVVWLRTWEDELATAVHALRFNPTQDIAPLENGLTRPRANVLLSSDLAGP